MNGPTLYEIVATHADGRKLLIAYSIRRSRRALVDALRSDKRVDDVLRVLGDAFEYAGRAGDGLRIGDWAVNFSGRTMKDCQTTETARLYIGKAATLGYV